MDDTLISFGAFLIALCTFFVTMYVTLRNGLVKRMETIESKQEVLEKELNRSCIKVGKLEERDEAVKEAISLIQQKLDDIMNILLRSRKE